MTIPTKNPRSEEAGVTKNEGSNTSSRPQKILKTSENSKELGNGAASPSGDNNSETFSPRVGSTSPRNNDANGSPKKTKLPFQVFQPNSFEPENHFYPRALNSQIHPTVRFFMGLTKERICQRFCHNHPEVDPVVLQEALAYRPKYMLWAGCDLMHTTSDLGRRDMVVIETNTCASGQKSTPLFEEMEEEGGYKLLLQRTFVPILREKEAAGTLPSGELAVIYDKNFMEASGYAAALAELTSEKVFLVPCIDERFLENPDEQGCTKFEKGVLYVRNAIAEDDTHKNWRPIRAAWRYVTQRPWCRIPLYTTTLVVNPVISCLAGGRNKMVAAKAYDNYNVELQASGLRIRTPLTIRDVKFEAIPEWVRRLGGHAVVKIPYSNAGQGVYTITNERELKDFIEKEKNQNYDLFIVQSLISNHKWSSNLFDNGGPMRKMYHTGTIPDKKGNIFVADLRMMVSSDSTGSGGYKPVGIYARRARAPLADTLCEDGPTSWEMLGTNLSVKKGEGLFDTESGRLLLMDRKDFNTLGMGIDDLVDAFVQTVLSVVAIDRMAQFLAPNGVFDPSMFRSVNNDQALLDEINLDGIEMVRDSRF